MRPPTWANPKGDVRQTSSANDRALSFDLQIAVAPRRYFGTSALGTLSEAWVCPAYISWVRRVAEDGELRIIDHRLRLRRAASEYVVATLATGRDELVIRLDGRIIATYRHAIDEKVIRPLVGGGG